MIIKIDCREKELINIMKPETPKTSTTAAAAAAHAEPDYYIMDLGDGMTMKVPLPKPKQSSQKSKPIKPTPKPKSLENHEIISERLPIGDIILHDPSQGQQKDIVIFERKTLADLAASIRDGRYKEQSFRLIETAAAKGFHTHHIIYIIEGDLARYDERHTQITKTAIQSAMVSLMYYKGFSVIRTMNLGETADFILNFADKVAKESADGMKPAHDDEAAPAAPAQAYSEVSAKKEKRDFITRENIGEIMLAQVPGVSAKMAAAILAKYGGSLYEFLGDLHRKISDYEESVSAVIPPETTIEPMNKNKYKHVSECFKDILIDGKRGIGKLTVEKLCFFLG